MAGQTMRPLARLLVLSCAVLFGTGPGWAQFSSLVFEQKSIGQASVNNRSADTAPRNVQNTTTLVDLGANRLVAAWYDSGSFPGGSNNHLTGYAWSSNNGVSWTDAGTLPASSEGDAGNPVLAANKTNGHVYLATLGFNTLTKIQVFKSTNFGHTFGAPVNGSPGYSGTGNVQDRPWIAVDSFAGAGSGNVYLCWNRFPIGGNSQIRFTRSTNGGASFTPNLGTLVASGGPGCFIVVSPNHQVNVFYIRGTGTGGQGGDNKLYMRRSLDRGVTFQPAVLVADLKTTTTWGNLKLNGGLQSNSFPQAAVNPVAARPYLYVVYNDDPTPPPGGSNADNGDIYLVRSTNNGVTWTAPLRVNDDLTRDQFLPNIAFVNAGERLMMTWFSRSHDTQNHMYHRRGRIALLNAAGLPVFNSSFQLGPNTIPTVNPRWPGDYQGIAGGAGAVSTAWADTRFSTTVSQPDVFFARIALPPTNADLGIDVSAVPATVPLGKTTVIKAVVRATGAAAADVVFHLNRTHGLAYQSASVVGGSCRLINQSVDCSLGTIAAGGAKTVNVVAAAIYSAATRTVTAGATTSSRDTALASPLAPLAPNIDSVAVPVSARPTVTETFSSQNIAIPIHDIGSATVRLGTTAIKGTDAVQIVARVRLNHTFDDDLEIRLYSLTDQGFLIESAHLSSRNGGSGDNYGMGPNDCTGSPTVFSDLASTSIRAGSPPFANIFLAEDYIAKMLGRPVAGIYELHVIDRTTNLQEGRIGCFQLTITYAPN